MADNDSNAYVNLLSIAKKLRELRAPLFEDAADALDALREALEDIELQSGPHYAANRARIALGRIPPA